MKTKMLVVFLLMMIVPVCACADVVTISELYQNTPDFWTTMISADGTQQEITVPVYIPEVTDVPILRVKHKQFTDDDLVVLGGSIQKSNYYNFVIRNQGEYDVSSDDNGYYNEAVHMPAWACDDLNTVYAQNQSESLGAVIDKANARIKELTGMELFVHRAQICTPYLRRRPKTFEYGDPYPLGDLTGVGGYGIEGVLSIDGIPVLGSVENGVLVTVKDTLNVEMKKQARCMVPTYFSDEFYFYNVQPWELVAEEVSDVPLCSFDKVEETIRSLIQEGKIGTIYSLRLGYAIFADKDYNYPKGKDGWETAEYLLIPTWFVECTYFEDGKPEHKQKDTQAPDAYDYRGHNTDFADILINAQTGVVYDPENGLKSRCYAPPIQTW